MTAEWPFLTVLVVDVVLALLNVSLKLQVRRLRAELARERDRPRQLASDELRRVRSDLAKQVDVQKRIEAQGLKRSIGASRN